MKIKDLKSFKELTVPEASKVIGGKRPNTEQKTTTKLNIMPSIGPEGGIIEYYIIP